MEKKLVSSPERIDTLQALRFFGAMCITVYHFSGLQGNCPFDFSHAVYLFYMISGFVVMLSTRVPEKKKYFLTRRLVRILPLYWGLTVFTFAAGMIVPSVVGYRPTVEQLVKSMLFIPFDRPTAKAGTAIRPLVGLGHTLQMEMLFYVLFLLAMRISHKYRGALAAGFAAAVAAFGVFFPVKEPIVHFYTANPYVWTSFIIGLAIYGVYSLIQKRQPKLYTDLVSVLFPLAAVAVAVPALLRRSSVWYDIFLFAVTLAAGLAWAVCGRRTPKPFVKLGNISYSYYLLHYYTVTVGARLLGIDSFSVRNVLLAALISAATWGISRVSWYTVENRLSGFLQSKLIRTEAG